MKATVETDEHGNIHIPLSFDIRQEVTLDCLQEDYRIVCETEGLDSEETENALKEAFKTLIDYYGGNFND